MLQRDLSRDSVFKLGECHPHEALASTGVNVHYSVKYTFLQATVSMCSVFDLEIHEIKVHHFCVSLTPTSSNSKGLSQYNPSVFYGM